MNTAERYPWTESFSLEPNSGSLLISDDQPEIREALRLLLKNEGYKVETVASPAAVLQALESGNFDLLMVDLNYTRDTTSGTEGLELISHIRESDQEIPILALTAWGTINLAVEAMRLGASDFIQKPWGNQDLVKAVKRLIDRYRSARRSRRLEEMELEDAISVQHRLIPREIAGVEGVQVYGGFLPVRYVGGDYYNVTRLGEHTLALSIADVSGKGVPAALLGASLGTAATPLIRQQLSPREVCQALNQTIAEIIPEGKFISLFHGVIDTKRKILTYTNAGHDTPVLMRADGSMVELSAGGIVFGLSKLANYEQQMVPLKSGDRLILFTDGIIEAAEEECSEFGRERLIEFARRYRNLSAAEMYSKLLESVSEYCRGCFRDDATLVVVALE